MTSLVKNPTLQRIAGGGFLERAFLRAISSIQLSYLGLHKDPAAIRLIRQVRRQRRSLLTAYECYIVHSLARAQAQRPGDMAEVGVYEGCSARLIAEVKGGKRLNLFDTFEGLPESSTADRKVHSVKQYPSSLARVQEFLRGFSEVYFYKGLFPASAAGVPETGYGLVHFDVDLYESTLACLNYFYPRMLPGGIMLSHDYSLLAGVKQAFTEFLADKPESLIEMPTTQCIVVKC